MLSVAFLLAFASLVGVLFLAGVFGAVARVVAAEPKPKWWRIARWASVTWMLVLSALVGLNSLFDVMDAMELAKGADSGGKQELLAQGIAAVMQRFVGGALLALPGPVVVVVTAVIAQRRHEASSPAVVDDG